MGRVLVVMPYDIAHPGGVVSHGVNLARALRRLGWQPTLLAPASRPDGIPPDLPVVTFGRPLPVPASGSVARIGLVVRGWLGVRRFLRSAPFEVVHVHEPLVPLLPFAVLEYSRSVNIATFHATCGGPTSTPSLGYRLAGFFVRRWYERLDGRICVSEAARGFVSRFFPGDYRVIPNGIDFSRFAAPPRRSRPAPTILFVGRLERRKGLPVLLEAFRLVRQRFPEARLEIVGPDGGLRRWVEDYIGRHRLDGVELAGFLPEEEVVRRYRSAWVFCAPATGGESFGLVLLEAMAAGLPVVASDIPGYREVAGGPSGAVLVPPRDPAALARELVGLISDPDRRTELGRRGQEWAARFDWDRVARQVVEVYRTARRVAAQPAWPDRLLLASGP
jgi:phosphatidylinositol alpha-mannosyltransferase